MSLFLPIGRFTDIRIQYDHYGSVSQVSARVASSLVLIDFASCASPGLQRLGESRERRRVARDGHGTHRPMYVGNKKAFMAGMRPPCAPCGGGIPRRVDPRLSDVAVRSGRPGSGPKRKANLAMRPAPAGLWQHHQACALATPRKWVANAYVHHGH